MVGECSSAIELDRFSVLPRAPRYSTKSVDERHLDSSSFTHKGARQGTKWSSLHVDKYESSRRCNPPSTAV